MSIAIDTFEYTKRYNDFRQLIIKAGIAFNLNIQALSKFVRYKISNKVDIYYFYIVVINNKITATVEFDDGSLVEYKSDCEDPGVICVIDFGEHIYDTNIVLKEDFEFNA
jgi:hypothetical protein